jgi:transcription antitermination factor NusG
MQADIDYTLQEYYGNLVQDERLKGGPMYEKALRSLAKSNAAEAPRLGELTDALLQRWVDTLLTRLTLETLLRYVESLSKIYTFALRDERVTDRDLFVRLRRYADTLRGEGIDKSAPALVENIRRIARPTVPLTAGMALAADLLLYAFYEVTPIETLLTQRLDGPEPTMPQLVALRRKYSAPNRKYLFPLNQWATTPAKLQAGMDRSIRQLLQALQIDLGDKTPEAWLSAAWAAAAQTAGIAPADILAFRTLPPEAQAPLKQRVAHTICDMNCHWYALRFTGKEETVQRILEERFPDVPLRIFYPMDEIHKKKGKRITRETRPTLRNILFLETLPATLDLLARERTDTTPYAVVRNYGRRGTPYAIIPNEEMRRFCAFVSNGLDIMPVEEVVKNTIAEGAYVRVTEGPYKDFRGRVIKVKKKGAGGKSSQENAVEMLKIQAECFGEELQQVLGEMVMMVPMNCVVTVKEE